MTTNISSKRYRLSVTLLEDLHSGTGTGSASLDAVQIRGRDGRSVIRDTHLKGLLRDTATRLRDYLPTEITDDSIDALFGKEKKAVGQNNSRRRRGALILTSLYLVDNAKGKNLLRTSTARKPLDRTPLEDTLRSFEYVASNSHFTGLMEIRSDNCEGMRKLLERFIYATDRLGSRRTRGDGLVTMKLNEVNAPPVTSDIPERKAGQTKVRLLLRNIEPLSFPATGFPGNIIPTHCYISGRVLRGAFAEWAVVGGEDISPLLERNTIHLCNAYPLPISVADISSFDVCWDVIPIPLHIQMKKPQGCNNPECPWWADFLIPSQEKISESINDFVDGFNTDSKDQREKPKRPSDREFLFRKTTDAPWTRFAPSVGVHLRNKVPRVRGGRDEGELFSVEEIMEDTYFLEEIEFANEETAKWFEETYQPILRQESWLLTGRGGRPIEVAAFMWLENVSNPSHESNRDPNVDRKNALRVTLTSDLIARSPKLAFYDSLDVQVLAELLECSEEELARIKDQSCKHFCDTVQIHGFNAATGLPRSPALAIRRGSTIEVEGNACEILREKLSERLKTEQWLGEQTRDGFGRFRLDFDPMVSGFTKKRSEPAWDDVAGNNEALLEKARELSKQILLPKKNNGGPSKSQWYDLRERARVDNTTDKILKLIKDIEEHAGKLSGKPWKDAIDKIKKAMLPDASLEAKKLLPDFTPVENAKLFLDALVRWKIVEIEKSELLAKENGEPS